MIDKSKALKSRELAQQCVSWQTQLGSLVVVVIWSFYESIHVCFKRQETNSTVQNKNRILVS